MIKIPTTKQTMLMNRSVLNGELTIIVLTLAENQEIKLSILSAMVDGLGEGQWSMVAVLAAHLGIPSFGH
jgi:hypothetical protein